MSLRLAAAALLLLVAACAGEEAEGVRVVIHTYGPDGPAPDEGFALRAMGLEGPGVRYPLVPDGGSTPGARVARGAPAGNYVLESPQGWGQLWVAGAVSLRPGDEPVGLRVGRWHSAYLVPAQANFSLGREWGLQRLEENARPGERIPNETDYEDGGRLVVLRVPPEHWHGTLAAVGTLAGGGVSGLTALRPAERLPAGVLVEAGGTGTLDVVAVPARTGQAVDGRVVTVRVVDVPIELVRRARVSAGAARVHDVPGLTRPLDVSWGAGGAVRLTYDAWGREGALFLLAFEEGAPTRRLAAPVEEGHVPIRVHVRPEGLANYGLVPFEVEDGRVVFSAPEGAFRLRLQTARDWSEPIAVEAGATSFAAPVWREAAQVRGRVEGVGSAASVRLHVREEDAEVLAQGLALVVPAGAGFEARVPPGTYEVEVVTAAGTWRRPAPLEIARPGAVADLTLRPTR